MATFELTATRDISRPSLGLEIHKGDRYTIHINMNNIAPNNLFNNSRCQDALIQQFKMNGIDVPKSDAGIYNRGAWDIKMK